MNSSERVFTVRRIAEIANEAAAESSRLGAPFLSEGSPVSELIRWLEWNDGNGSYRSNEFPPLSVEEAWELIEGQVE